MQLGPTWLQIQFWDALDFIGIDAYYPLATVADPSLAVIEAAWAPWKAVVAAYAEQWQRPVIFTEIGYRSYSLAAVEPWAFTGNGPADLLAQLNLYSAFFNQVYSEPYFAGVFWWAWGVLLFASSVAHPGRRDQRLLWRPMRRWL